MCVPERGKRIRRAAENAGASMTHVSASGACLWRNDTVWAHGRSGYMR